MAGSKPGAKHWLVPLTVVCVVLGGMLGIQVRSQKERGQMQVGRQTSALVGMVSRTEAQLEQQREETERVRALLAQYEEEAASERGLLRVMKEELQASRIALGTVAVRGPGIELQLSDSTRRSIGGIGAEDLYVVHDSDLLHIANELWAAGAEAVALNGQRLVTASSIVCSARLIEVNGVAIASPFLFQAIGDKDKLVSALNIRGGVLDGLRLLEFPVKLTPKDAVTIPPLSVTPKHVYAQPVERENKP